MTTRRRQPILCGCGRPTRDQAATCDPCINELTIALASVPFIVEQLDVTLAHQKSPAIATTRAAGNPTEAALDQLAAGLTHDLHQPVDLATIHGLPWTESAARARRQLRRVLATWARHCHTHHYQPPHRITPPGVPWAMTRREAKALDQITRLPDDANPAQVARWLSARVHHLRLDPDGNAAARALVRAIADARAVVFYKRKARIYLGRCDLVANYRNTAPEPCDGDVYAQPDDPIGACQTCGREVTVVIRQAHLEQLLDDTLCTAAEIATCAVYLGLPASRERIRKIIAAWKKRGRITAKAGTDDDPKYRYGDVVPLLYATYTEPTRRTPR